jgi:hypothetical protein
VVEALERGDLDIVGLARPMLADAERLDSQRRVRGLPAPERGLALFELSRWFNLQMKRPGQGQEPDLVLSGPDAAAKGIHVAHFNIDGGVRSPRRPDPSDQPDSTLDPDAIAQTYIDVLAQPRNAWSHEIDLRPWTERF